MSNAVTHSGSRINPASNLALKLSGIWLVMILTPVAVWWQVANGTAGVTLAIAGAAVELVAIGVLWVVVVRHVYRLHELVHAARTGTYDLPIETDRSDIVGHLYEDFSVFRDDLASYADSVEATNRRMNDIATDQAAVMQACADGDFTQRMDADTGVPQLDMVAYEFNRMVDDLETLVANVQAFSDDIVAIEGTLSEERRRGETAAATISDVVEAITEATARQSDDLDEVVTEMDNLSSSVTVIADGTDDLATTFEQMTTRATNGRDSAQEAIDRVAEVEQEVNATADTVRELDELTVEISTLNDRIEAIAKGANLLAKKAEREVDEERDASGGFEVFADQLGEFAENTWTATTEIRRRLTTFRDQADEAVTSIERTERTVERSAGTIESALGELGEIADGIEDANQTVGAINRVTSDQATTAEAVVERVDAVSTESDRTAALSDDVSAAATEQVGALENIWTGVERLTDRAESLSARLDQFETRPDAGTGGGPGTGADGVAGRGDGPGHGAGSDSGSESGMGGQR